MSNQTAKIVLGIAVAWIPAALIYCLITGNPLWMGIVAGLPALFAVGLAATAMSKKSPGPSGKI
ncbi:hypothetical protein [Micromonospora sp. NPDC001898]|uniref:hypothetical protein n=1 Tax=Micromonospora sp. NPDC001898 TaxID=3364221 RepID=UPI003674F0FE